MCWRFAPSQAARVEHVYSITGDRIDYNNEPIMEVDGPKGIYYYDILEQHPLFPENISLRAWGIDLKKRIG